MKKRLFAFIITFLAPHALLAQTAIAGHITDGRTGEPLIGATVLPASSKETGVVTDIDGNFILHTKAKLPLTLSVRCFGYRSQEIDVYDDAEPVEVQLLENLNRMEDVVVVGYGTQKRTQLTGSVATIGSSQLEVFPAPTLDAALGGMITGVDVTANGQPGAGSTIRIRGGNSVNASNNPLYVIDGFIYQVDDSSQKTGIGSLESTSDPLSFINPGDIERIEVLKDVSATAIYGSRGANGVIIISTKKGNYRETHVRYKTTISLNTPSKKLDLLNAAEWARMEKDYFGNRGGYTDDEIAALGKGTD
ncbi:MAG: TonB-dependent receptor plug domain-containing protein, partial [Bacteroidaceae bacterium]|nr:TonB-dependent receptor plug domain-containing protein [Bacteroidaceae bacterium]